MMLECLILLVPGYRWLYEVPKILHRHIKLNNLKLRKEDCNVYAVLNDLDPAINADGPGRLSNRVQVPCHSWRLTSFTDIQEPYRHDFNSLVYVLVRITSRFHKEKEIEDPPLKSWAREGHEELLALAKFGFPTVWGRIQTIR